MITLFVIGILILSIKFIVLACKATWGMAKALLFIIGLPVILIGLLIAGHIIGSPSFNYNTDSSIYLEFCETILKRS